MLLADLMLLQQWNIKYCEHLPTKYLLQYITVIFCFKCKWFYTVHHISLSLNKVTEKTEFGSGMAVKAQVKSIDYSPDVYHLLKWCNTFLGIIRFFAAAVCCCCHFPSVFSSKIPSLLIYSFSSCFTCLHTGYQSSLIILWNFSSHSHLTSSVLQEMFFGATRLCCSPYTFGGIEFCMILW